MDSSAGMTLLLAYLLGSTPTAYIVGRRAGVDIRQVGDGNAGSKNTFLQLGLGPGVFVGVVDISKGALAIWVARWLGATETLIFLAGFAAVIGHDFPVFLKFHGGQGMATALGVLGTLQPFGVGLGVIVALIMLRLTRNWDLSWAVGLGLVPVNGWVLGRTPPEIWFAVLLLPTIGLKKLIDMALTLRGAHEQTP